MKQQAGARTSDTTEIITENNLNTQQERPQMQDITNTNSAKNTEDGHKPDGQEVNQLFLGMDQIKQIGK